MSTPIDQAIAVTGWDKSIIAYLYDEFVETDEEDFLDYIADYVGDTSFTIVAANGGNLDACLAAFAQGRRSVLDPAFEVEDMRTAIQEANNPPEDDTPEGDGYDIGSLPEDEGELFGGVPPIHDV